MLCFVLVNWLPDSIFAPLNCATAFLSGECLALFGKKAVVSGDSILMDGFRVLIVPECTAFYSLVLYCAFLLSVPASVKARMGGMLAGAAFLCSVNILRIAAVTAVGAGRPALFEIFHVYLGQVVMVIMIIAACLAWLHQIHPQRPHFKAITLLIRVGIYSSLLFLVWFVFNVHYVRLTDDHVIRWFFSLNNVKLEIPYEHLIYYQTFNIVTILGLIMAAGAGLLQRKVRVVAAGFVTIVVLHILFRLGNVLMTAYGMDSARKISDLIYIIGQYIIPLLFWLLILQEKKQLKENQP
jgi:exosortase H (IPTLxxWG-CTERM-specific)